VTAERDMRKTAGEVATIGVGARTGRKTSSLSEGDALWHLLRRTTRVIQKSRERELRKYNTTIDGAAVLLAIIRQGRMATAAGIARELLLEPHSVSEQLTRMEKNGLILRVRDLERKNLVRIAVTERGYLAYRNSAKRISIRSIMSELTTEELEQLWLLLARLRSRAMKRLNLDAGAVYPPADIAEFRTNFGSSTSAQ
jgi:DNA-binding MarR family transcriptional regulator